MVLLDLNTPAFQEDLFSLERQDLLAVLSTLKKIPDLEWTQLYADRGLRWEAIHNRTTPGGKRIYSLRVTKRFRAIAFREGDHLCLLSLHPDHDSAY
jgi:hypothetical protein